MEPKECILSLSPHFNGHFFPGQPALVGFTMEVVVTTGAMTCKARVKSLPPTNNQHATFYRPDAACCHQTNKCPCTEGIADNNLRRYTFGLRDPRAPGIAGSTGVCYSSIINPGGALNCTYYNSHNIWSRFRLGCWCASTICRSCTHKMS